MPDSPLPAPTDEAQAHSQALVECIRQRINLAGGHISFRDFMDMALYQPGLGYYSAGSIKFGADGDFITAPELSSLFGYCVARQTAQALATLKTGDIMEIGAGSGKLCADILNELDSLEQLPEHYFILETSPDLQQRQQQALKSQAPNLADRVSWLHAPPEKFCGVIIANEVIDALPVERFKISSQGIQQAIVTTSGDQLQLGWSCAPEELSAAVQALNITFNDEYSSEINLHMQPWLHSITENIDQALILFIDYGYPRSEYYQAQRRQGTLNCHYRHHLIDDPLFFPGLQDITAFIDFTALAESASASHLNVCGYTSQANFLIGCGIDQVLQKHLPDDPVQTMNMHQQVQQLMLPGEMGERFQVMALTRGLDDYWIGFQHYDRRHVL